MNVETLSLPGLIRLTPKRHGDARGWFTESWHRDRLQEHGIEADFVQDNHSFSRDAGTLRGLHYQSPPHAQAKLVRCVRGAVTDIAVDVRRGSPTYGKWERVELDAVHGQQLFVPVGFLHGFVTRTPHAEIEYKCSDYYAPECDGVIAFDDPDLAIDWGVSRADVILSEKDARAPAFAGFRSPFVFGEEA